MKLPPRSRVLAAIPLSSTADIAFLLLIFFIVLARTTSEATVNWEPAESRQRLIRPDDTVATVVIDEKGRTFVNGIEAFPDDVGLRVADLLGERPPGKRVVLVKIDRRATADQFEKVFSLISEQGGELFRVVDPASNAPGQGP